MIRYALFYLECLGVSERLRQKLQSDADDGWIYEGEKAISRGRQGEPPAVFESQ